MVGKGRWERHSQPLLTAHHWSTAKQTRLLQILHGIKPSGKKTGKILKYNETNLHNITVFFMGLSRNLENKNPIKIPQDLQVETQATDMNMKVWKGVRCTGGRPGMCKSYKKSSFSV